MPTLFPHPTGLPKISVEASILIVLVLAVQWLCGRRLQPRWRCALWLLVLLRLALPWTIPSPTSVFNLFKLPAAAQQTLPPADPAVPAGNTSITSISNADGGGNVSAFSISGHWIAWLWAAGALCLAGGAAVNHFRIHRRIMQRRPLIDVPTLNLLEDCKALMGITTPVTLIEMESIGSPTLFGFVRPRLLLPAGLVSSFTRDELRHVFLHELAHIKRRDVLAAWFALVLQAIHWFNPFVWLAFHRLRADRELACDAMALSYAKPGENESYGLTIVKLLEGFGRSVWAPSLAGILEDKKQTRERIRMIARFQKTNHGLALAIALLAGLALITLTDAQNQAQPHSAKTGEPDASKGVWAVRFEPIGDFSPKTPGEFLDKIHIYSGQHGEIGYFRTTKQGDKLIGSFLASDPNDFKDALAKVPGIKVTSVEKLTQETLAEYEKSPQESLTATDTSDKSAAAEPAPPKIIATSPAAGATDVDPSLTEITVTFDQDMSRGMSWTGGGPDFPSTPQGKKAQWKDKRTCALPVKLDAAHYYRVGINASSYQNFRSARGAAVEPSAIFFTTQGADEKLKARTHVPTIVRCVPENGAQDVSPTLLELRVTFNVPMGGGCSWCTVGDDDSDFPKIATGKNYHWTPDKKTCVLPVALAPGRTYRLSLNAPGFNNFQSDAGVPLEPVSYTFKTTGNP